MKVAVIAHRGKTFGGGLPELRAILERRGVHDLQWREVPKSRKAPKQVRKAMEWGADLIFVWGGDGMAQRSIDALDGADTPIALLPAGTANLLAANLGIPKDVEGAVDVGPARRAEEDRHRPDQRRDVRRHGRRGAGRADDRGRRRRPEGPPRAARATSGPA